MKINSISNNYNTKFNRPHFKGFFIASNDKNKEKDALLKISDNVSLIKN